MKLKSSHIDTPLGKMLAVGDDTTLYLLEFVERKGLAKQLERLKKKTKAEITAGKTGAIDSIERELKQYFQGALKVFKTPLILLGTPFQIQVWKELQKIPPGQTRAYSEIAVSLDKPTACRAVAMANSQNALAIIVPCHRVININGATGGYAGGIDRKVWLLAHEK